jgi:hypothetical protein
VWVKRERDGLYFISAIVQRLDSLVPGSSQDKTIGDSSHWQ